MLLLNYTHPITEAQREQLQTLLGEVPEIRNISVQSDRSQTLEAEAHRLADGASLDAIAWQTTPLIINPPGLAALALALIAEIHGRSGSFPAILNIRPVLNTLPTRYEIAEIANLQAIRDQARVRRIKQE